MRVSSPSVSSPAPEQITVCVAMCTYNGGQYLQEQLNSIAAQTQHPTLMVIPDNRSSDHPVAIAMRFACHLFPVRVDINERNLFAKNFEKAICLAKSDVTILRNQDDVWHPSKANQTTAARPT